jgi:hypothetical protein
MLLSEQSEYRVSIIHMTFPLCLKLHLLNLIRLPSLDAGYFQIISISLKPQIRLEWILICVRSFVFVHGLNPRGRRHHAYETWTYAEGGKPWPYELLSQDFPDARISIVGYNSNVTSGGSGATISDHANSLLNALQGMRQDGPGVRLEILPDNLTALFYCITTFLKNINWVLHVAKV